MKARTSEFKNALVGLKETKIKITYGSIELGDEQLNSIQPHYESGILTSVMKQLDLDSNVEIPKGTILNLQFGVKVREASGNDDGYDYINYGNYIVKESEKQEDTNSYLLTCYDKMLYSMKDYEKIQYRNLFDKDTENYKKGYYLNSLGVETSGTNWGTYYIKVKPNTSYTISGCQTNGGVQFCWFNSNKTFISAIGQKQDRTNITSPSNAGYIGLSIVWNTTSSAYDGTTFMLQEGSVATDYEPFGDIQYPITIRKYIDLLCNKIGLTFKDRENTFTNYDKTIEKELYLDENGNSLNYTYRDVLDELAQATASTICINEDDDTLEIRYITNAGETTTNVSGTDLSITSEDSQVNNIQLLGNTTQNGTPTPSSPQEVVNVTGRQEIKCVGKNLYNSNDTTYYYNCIYVSGANTNQYKVKATGTDVIINSQVSSGSSYSASAGTLIPCKYGETIYYDTGNANFGKNFITQYNSNKVSLGFTTLNTGYSSGSYTPTNSECKYISIRIGYGNATSGTEYTLAPIISKSSNLTYEPYKEETNEINLGKNLANPSNINMQCGLNDSGAMYSGATTRVCVYKVPIKPSTTYSLSCENGYQIGNVFQYDSGGTYTSTVSSSYARTKQYTSSSTTYYISFVLKNDDNTTIDISEKDNLNVQIEVGTLTEYSPYFTPIELCKIGTYQDKIFKNSGKNLYNKDKPRDNYYYNNNGEQVVGAGDSFVNISFKPTQNKISTSFASKNGNAYVRLVEYNASGTFIKRTLINTNTTTTLDSNTKSVIFCVDENSNDSFTNLQIEVGSTATEYEPYGSGEWYKKAVIGKTILTSDNVTYYATGYNTSLSKPAITIPKSKLGAKTSDYSTNKALINTYHQVTAVANIDNGSFSTNFWDNHLLLFNDAFTNLATGQSLLIGTKIYIVQATPTYTKLNDTLQEQLNSIRLLEGLNNITTNVPIDLTYVSGIDTLDEEYFNEDNVNFGEMYGPVNTIILSRSAESDEIAQSIPSNLSDDEKVAIKIKENQIMNFNNRDEYLYGILTRLYGLRYTQNDYSSKGICYYNICDRYKANIFGKDYYCVMLNDDVTIESGLSENVFTELPETAETDYSKTSTSDRIERQTTLIVDKQAGIITARVKTIEDEIDGEDTYQLTQDERYLAGKTYYILQNSQYVVYTNYSVGDVITGDIYEVVNNGILGRIQATEIKQTNQALEIDVIDSRFNSDGSAKSLKTENEPVDPTKKTTYTFDKDGIKIGKTSDDYSSLQDNTGTYYYEKGTMIGKYTKDGSVQKDLALYGKYYYGIDEEGNFNVNTFERSDALFLAQLYEKDSEQGFGHFWNGE